MCYETPLRFNISLREIFLKSGSPRVMKRCDESAVMEILQKFGILYHCWLSKVVLKHCFLESGLTKSFTACKFRNKKAMTIIFFLKMFKIWCRFQKWEKKWQKFLVLKISGFESSTTNSLNLEKNPCHWQSMCYETSLRFNISLREIFFKSGSIRALEKYDESAIMQILQVLGTL